MVTGWSGHVVILSVRYLYPLDKIRHHLILSYPLGHTRHIVSSVLSFYNCWLEYTAIACSASSCTCLPAFVADGSHSASHTNPGRHELACRDVTGMSPSNRCQSANITDHLDLRVCKLVILTCQLVKGTYSLRGAAMGAQKQ